MQLTINGESQSFDAPTNLSELVQSLSLEGKRLAIEVNEAIVPKSQYSEHTLQNNDIVEIVQAIGGG